MAEESYATVLFLLVIDTYGAEVLPGADRDGWHPETIKLELEADFKLTLPKESLDKIMAAITIYTTNFFYKDVVKFIELCNILSGDDFQPDEFDPADAGEILWGVTEAMLIYPPDDEDMEDTGFSDEIRTYIGEVLNDEGIASPPDVLRLGLTGPAMDIGTEFADDPEMYQAVWETQEGKTNDLKEMLTRNLRELYMQVKMLPMQRGDKGPVLQQMQQVLGIVQESGNE